MLLHQLLFILLNYKFELINLMEKINFAIGKLRQKYLIFDVLSLSTDGFSHMLEMMTKVNKTYKKAVISNY